MSESLKFAQYFMENYSRSAVGVIQQMPVDMASGFIDDIDDSLSILTLKNMLPTAAVRCLEAMPASSASRYLNQLNAKDAANILRCASDRVRKRLLEGLSRRHAFRTSMMLRYPKTLVGGWMDTITVCLQPDDLIVKARNRVIECGYTYRDVVVVNGENEILGVVSMLALLQHRNTKQVVAEIMRPVENPIVASLTLEKGIEWKAWLKQDTLPVIDGDSKLVGIVRFVDLWGAIADSSSAELVKRSNIHVFGVLEICSVRMADLMTAMLSINQSSGELPSKLSRGSSHG